MALQAGIVDLRDRGVLLEKPGYLQCALVVMFHSEGERLDAAVQQEGSVWIKAPSQMVQFVVTFSIRLDFPTTAPATMSEWPLRYLVALWRDRSKPNSNGRKFTGLAKVLSIMETSPWLFAKLTTDSRSGTCIRGFEMVSTYIALVVGFSFRFHDSGSLASMKS